MVNLSLVFTENQNLVGFSPIMKVSFQGTKGGAVKKLFKAVPFAIEMCNGFTTDVI